MRLPNLEITTTIKTKTLELLMHKDPSEIGMRDIAKNCEITAPNIYHYYKDKDTLFQAISLDCLNELNQIIINAAENEPDTKQQIVLTIHAFRDWCFQNPRKALLVLSKIKSVSQAPQEIIEKYYVCNRTGVELLKASINKGIAKSSNPELDVGILVNGLWGCIESVILKKCDVEYWEKGKEYTDRFIEIWMNQLFI